MRRPGLTSARHVLGYEPQDDSEVVYADDIRELLIGPGSTDSAGRVGSSREPPGGLHSSVGQTRYRR